MSEYTIQLTDMEQIRAFHEIARKYPFKMELLADRYKIDAKSMMGIFSLDLSHPLTLEVSSDAPAELERDIQPFLVKGYAKSLFGQLLPFRKVLPTAQAVRRFVR